MFCFILILRNIPGTGKTFSVCIFHFRKFYQIPTLSTYMQRILNKGESTDKQTNKRKNIDENPGIKKRKPG